MRNGWNPSRGRLRRRGWLTAYQLNEVFRGHAASLVLGQYVVLERIGEGGMGQVLKARHMRLHRIAALKVIRPERLKNPDVPAPKEQTIEEPGGRYIEIPKVGHLVLAEAPDALADAVASFLTEVRAG